ncbi:uncharacterized protein PFL1_00153 [Pseudozyma flocculosa PF-1]|uniref:Trehalase n=1 Tax=Pseudozyma flocculosa TaxID=84751 RepID=A0A5C3ES40_9BASI|nr:uncharacterized protein PFL1_00153 [Pseudozyma flocculosa PF-1]EPQ31954.1 hypothetical protein PFL1_00153 [Pseudozyma flocculosa PF-1]SPO35133.1 related to trehalase precursor [Pseudozyma flocculosa]
MQITSTFSRVAVAAAAALLSASAVSAQSTPAAVPAVPEGQEPSSIIPSGPVPPKQVHCTSPIYCPGPLLQAVQLAGIFKDSKTFVDKPTTKPEADVVAAFQKLGDGQGGNVTYQEIIDFVNGNFAAEGSELVPADLSDEFVEEPKFLSNITDPLVRDFTKQVHSYWKLLARTTNETSPSGTQCDGCVGSFIPFKERRPVVAPGGRFRELYYWDTFFTAEALIKSQLKSVVKSLIENLGDLLEQFGFVPNGNRVYYENRSQPPFLTLMVDRYVEAYNDTSILVRFLPLLEREMEFWRVNRTIEFTSPYTQKKHNITRYVVDTNGPRPESYKEDYITVENATASGLTLNDTQKGILYSNLASGAESGMDYSASRWSTRPLIDPEDTIPAQRFLNTQEILPVDLNSILYRAEQKLAAFYRMPINGSRAMTNQTRAKYWIDQSQKRKEAILDVFYNEKLHFFYDFNMTSGDRSPLWHAAGYFPLWAEILPNEFTNQSIPVRQRRESMQSTFAGLRYLLDRYNGTMPASLLKTGQQWDEPNSWPPLVYIALQSLRSVPAMLARGTALPAPNGTFDLIPSESFGGSNSVNQLGQTEETLPPQPVEYSNSTVDVTDAGATQADNPTLHVDPLMNAGNETTTESWRDELVRELANRYVASALCSWRATGGKLNTTDPSLAPVPEDILKANGFENGTGAMFEKFSAESVDQAGGGGEYDVQLGFGWSNGVLIYIGGELGQLLNRPECPPVVAKDTTTASSS